MSGDGMEGMISALTNSSTGITSTTLWTEATYAVPLIVTLVVFAFGYRIVRKLVKSAPNGKAKI